MPSFDIVSEVDLQEVSNAVEQTRREVGQRYDFKGTQTELTLEGHEIKVVSDDDFKVKAVVDVLQSKLVRRKVDLKFLEYAKVESAAGGRSRQQITVHQGLDTDSAKDLVKRIKAAKLKVQAQIQEAQVRVSGKKRDDLQGVIALLREADFPRPLQFVNMRD